MSLCMCVPPSECKQKHSCYRYRKISHEYHQPFAELYEPHPDDPSVQCVNFVAIEGRRIKEIEE